MRRMKKGFTLIEVALFIAVTGALFVGIIIGTQSSIWQQKYNDSVQKFAGFLRNIYSEVSNTQGVNGGRSDKAIYGKLISFGQQYELDGESEIPADEQKIFVYDVIGDANGEGDNSIVEALKNLNVNVIVKEKNEINGSVVRLALAGIASSYTPIWGSVIETTKNTPTLYTGTIMIVRHPRSGTLNTLVSSSVLNINRKIYQANGSGNYASLDDLLTSELENNRFETKEVDFCLNPYGMGEIGLNRRDIRIVKNARNASGVEILGDSDNECARNE